MTAAKREAVLEGTKAAQRLHARFGTRKAVESGTISNVDVFRAADRLQAVLLFKRLHGLLGAYFTKPVAEAPGILVSTERDLHVQRFTAAHEVGHLYLGHVPSFDEDVGLWRSESNNLQEVAADAFASEFLLPRWLYVYHAKRHGWDARALQDPHNTYQLSLRLGASYDAVCWGLLGHRIVKPNVAEQLRTVEPKELKLTALAGRAELSNPWANVWVITECDNGLTFEGSPDDIVIFRFAEHASGGYLWDEAELREQGIELLADVRDEQGADDCGSDVTRLLLTRVREPRRYGVSLVERRPWLPTDRGGSVSVRLEMFGKEEGLPRHVRRSWAAA